MSKIKKNTSKLNKIARKYIEQITSKITPSKSLYLNKSYLENIPPTPLLSTPLGYYISDQLMTGQLDHINHAEMEHFSFSVITEGSKYFSIVGARLYDTLIQSNQTISTIDIQVNGDWNISLGSLKIWNKM